MTPKEKLVTVNENYSKKRVIQLLRTNRIEKILIVNKKNQLKTHSFPAKKGQHSVFFFSICSFEKCRHSTQKNEEGCPKK